MAITLIHPIVPAHNKTASARRLADHFGPGVGDKSPFSQSRFAVVRVGKINLTRTGAY